MTPLLVLRPEPGASGTAARARALGYDCVVAPLFEVRARAWEAPESGAIDAVMMTSANAARLGGPALARFIGLPLYCVGAATAAAAREAGFRDIVAGDGDADALMATIGREGVRRLLHLAGREHRDTASPGISVIRRIVYASEVVETLPARAIEALGRGAVALLHSPRAAALFAKLVREAGCEASAIACLSPAVALWAGPGWHRSAVAALPTDDALLAAAAALCDH